MRKKKILVLALCVVMTIGVFTGCGSGSKESKGDFDASKEINVISREDGSGTRGAFTELFGIVEENEKGEKVDMTTETADITSSTGVVLTSVEDNEYAIGYISLGSLKDSVKALNIDDVAATTENIKNGSYKISRPFNIATKGEISPQAEDFMNFITSEDGQKIVEEEGYISKENTGAFTTTQAAGKITIAGSSSVTPVMEKLKEAYSKVNASATIEISQSDSTKGMNSAKEGICDIGMASREVKDSELEAGLKNKVIALDGIAIVVNNNNTLENMTAAQVKEIYLGNLKVWNEVK